MKKIVSKVRKYSEHVHKIRTPSVLFNAISGLGFRTGTIVE